MTIWKSLLNKEKIDKYFRTEACPFSKRKKIKKKSITVFFGGLILIFTVAVLFLGSDSKQIQKPAVPSYDTNGSHKTDGGTSQQQTQNPYSSYSAPVTSGGSGGRSHAANQVIARSQGTDPANTLPMGFTIPIRLINALDSSDQASPVIAEVTDEVYGKDLLVIPAKTRVIGTASSRDGAAKLQVHFHTFVYPEGDQHNVQGIAMMLDGASGVAGDYHSEAPKRHIGKFIGNFVGGFANGMKERTSGGIAGVPYEVGSLRNGILNGVTSSAGDGVRAFSDDLSNTRPYVTVAPGQVFVLFLEQAYLP